MIQHDSEFPPDQIVLPQAEWPDSGTGAPHVTAKRVMDVALSAVAMPAILLVAFALLILNPFYNPGPVFYRQMRMGKGGKRINLWKFRTMREAGASIRAHDAPIETDRITMLGRFLRKTRIDELPNFINVLKGEMSVVGPRPEAWGHAVQFIQTVPYYASRFSVLPGITGLSQVRLGYADDSAAVLRKARFDHVYTLRQSIRLDLYIMKRTIRVIMTGFGAK